MILDLPHLKSINLGTGALEGRYDPSCSLKMEGNINGNELMFRSSESNIHYFEWIEFP